MPQFWFMKSSIRSAVVFGSTVTGLSVGAGAFIVAHSSTILAACAGKAKIAATAAAAIRLYFMNILPE